MEKITLNYNPWQYIEDKGKYEVRMSNDISARRDVFDLAKIPENGSSEWLDGRTIENFGTFYLGTPNGDSWVPRVGKEVRFVYFQTTVDLTSENEIHEFTITFDRIDDGCRIYVFAEGSDEKRFDPNLDILFLSKKPVTRDLKELVQVGKKNRIVVVQFNVATYSMITGFKLKATKRKNGEEDQEQKSFELKHYDKGYLDYENNKFLFKPTGGLQLIMEVDKSDLNKFAIKVVRNRTDNENIKDHYLYITESGKLELKKLDTNIDLSQNFLFKRKSEKYIESCLKNGNYISFIDSISLIGIKTITSNQFDEAANKPSSNEKTLVKNASWSFQEVLA